MTVKIFGRKIFGRNRLRMFQTYFKPKISKSKIFSSAFFPGALSFFGQNSVLIRRNRRSFQIRARLANYRLQPSSECI